MSRWRAMAVAAMLLPAAPSARSADLEYYTASDLAAECSAKPGDAGYEPRHGRCEGYVLGVSDAQQAAQGAGGISRVCLPPAANPRDVVVTVSVYLAAHPDKSAMAAQDLVIDALSAQFPCK